MEQRLSVITLGVADLERARRFYEEGLGWRRGNDHDEVVFFQIGGAVLALYPRHLLAKPTGSTPTATTPQQHRDYRRHWTPVHLDFIVPDVASAVRRAEAAGARLEEEIRTHEWGRIAVMADPFGHGFCLIEFIGRGYDAITTGRG